MRSRKIIYNIVVSFALQIVTIIAGLIIPRIIIGRFGSDINGLTTSITQFLGYIVLLEAGVGGVVRAALYKPLSNNDYLSISRIIKATQKFFRKIGIIFIIYVIGLGFAFPLISNDGFGYWFTFILVIIIGFSTMINYFIGLSNQVLLQADQNLYIINLLQIVTVILNTILVVVLVKLDNNIHVIKLVSSLLYAIKPLVLYIYTKKKYKLTTNCIADNSALNQKWDGFGHHIAFFLHSNMDVALITFFSSFKEVSVYSIHFMVVSAVEKLTNIFSSSIEAAFGNMIAKNEEELMHMNFKLTELISFMLVTIMFTSTAILINPFIKLYTSGITDAMYYRPIFAYIMTASQAVYCLRLPYNAVVLAAGHYRQTKRGAYIEVIINLLVSIVLLKSFGLVGVAIGTLVAMVFRTLQYANYMSSHIIIRRKIVFLKRVLVMVFNIVLIYIAILGLGVRINSVVEFSEWITKAILVFFISTAITFVLNYIFYKDTVIYSLNKLRNVFKNFN